ncbi:CPBP family intramembrane glutamic endopeptidase [Halalkalibacter okhensis]|uniref:CPBP family intramembrane glutamic endopeptidase n=1 Tax=Halalkalibacter okhensis TaxID=333138 RepID=UPI00068B8CC4|nr:type II CAAX endopeptidase family protein [Halalkalibacter okhensis]
MKNSRTGIENVKLWTIIPWTLFWGTIGLILDYIFRFNQYGVDFIGVYLYLIMYIWILRGLNKRNIRLSDLNGGEGVKVSWLKYFAFVPVVKLASGSIMVMLGLILLYMFPSIGKIPNSADSISNQLLPIEIFFTFLITIILAPIVEEIFFRGMMLNKWGQKYGLFKGIFFTSLIFAIVHPTSFFAAFLTSILYSILYVKTKKLYIPIIAHSFGNLIVFLPRIFLGPVVEDEEVVSPILIDIVTTFGLSMVLLSITIYGLYRMYPSDKTLPYFS